MLLIDGDILVYKCGFGAQRTVYQLLYDPNFIVTVESVDEVDDFILAHGTPLSVTKIVRVMPPETVYPILKATIDSIVSRAGYSEYQIILSSLDVLKRKELYPEYKANRKDTAKPFYYNLIRKLLTLEFKATLSPKGREADDLLGAKLYSSFVKGGRSNSDHCIASIDKDLNMIPGWHYNINTENTYWVSEDEANINFHLQLLTGDTADNIPGIPGIGPVTALKILDGVTMDSLTSTVYAVYLANEDRLAADTPSIAHPTEPDEPDEYAGWVVRQKAKDKLELAGKLLWICRKPNDDWVLNLGSDLLEIEPYAMEWSAKGRVKLCH